MDYKIALLPGDGVGAEVVPQARKVLEAVGTRFNHHFAFREGSLGWTALETVGEALPSQTVEICRWADAIILGAIGGPSENYTKRADAADPLYYRRYLLQEILGLTASFRPAKFIAPLTNVSPLKPHLIKHLDAVIVLDYTNTGFSKTRKIDAAELVADTVSDSFQQSCKDVEPLMRFCFAAAKARRGKLAVVGQAGRLAIARLWFRTAEKVSREYPEVELSTFAPDAGAGQFIRSPGAFDVITGDLNYFVGALSDMAGAMLGSIALVPGASLGINEDALASKDFWKILKPRGVYEPNHGSAPRRAGQDVANPTGTILSAAMLLRYSLRLENAAVAVEKAVDSVLERYRTYDIMEDGKARVGTKQMGDLVAEQVLRR